jgi:hypothetical protein
LVFGEKVEHALISAMKMQDTLKFKGFSKKKDPKSRTLRILVFKKAGLSR